MNFSNDKKVLRDTWACSKDSCERDNHISFFWKEQDKNNLNIVYNDRLPTINSKDFEREKFYFKNNNNCSFKKRDDTLNYSDLSRNTYYGEDNLLEDVNYSESILTASDNNNLDSYRKKLDDKVMQQSNYDREREYGYSIFGKPTTSTTSLPNTTNNSKN